MNSVFIHIRRGDFVKKRQDDLYVCNMEYYRTAMETITSQVAKPNFIFFTDDPAYVISNFNVRENQISLDNLDAPHKDLDLMKNCDHAILSNSTFSWWGAYLMENKQKKIVCPSIWNKKDPGLVNKLVPDSWIKI